MDYEDFAALGDFIVCISPVKRRSRSSAKGKYSLERRRERRRKQVELRFDRDVELFTEEYLKRRCGKDWPPDGLVFPSSSGTRLSAFLKVKEKWDAMIFRRVGSAEEGAVAESWRIHDFRRTVATGIQALQTRTEIIESVLNHLSATKSGIVGVPSCDRRLAHGCRIRQVSFRLVGVRKLLIVP